VSGRGGCAPRYQAALGESGFCTSQTTAQVPFGALGPRVSGPSGPKGESDSTARGGVGSAGGDTPAFGGVVGVALAGDATTGGFTVAATGDSAERGALEGGGFPLPHPSAVTTTTSPPNRLTLARLIATTRWGKERRTRGRIRGLEARLRRGRFRGFARRPLTWSRRRASERWIEGG
jgi:hypothetical protein